MSRTATELSSQDGKANQFPCLPEFPPSFHQQQILSKKQLSLSLSLSFCLVVMYEYVSRGCWVGREGTVGEEKANPWGWHITKTTYQLTWYRSPCIWNVLQGGCSGEPHSTIMATWQGFASSFLRDHLTRVSINGLKMYDSRLYLACKEKKSHSSFHISTHNN